MIVLVLLKKIILGVVSWVCWNVLCNRVLFLLMYMEYKFVLLISKVILEINIGIRMIFLLLVLV